MYTVPFRQDCDPWAWHEEGAEERINEREVGAQPFLYSSREQATGCSQQGKFTTFG